MSCCPPTEPSKCSTLDWLVSRDLGQSIIDGDFYHLHRFDDVLTEAKHVNLPHFQWIHFHIVTAAGQPGRRADAQAAVDALERVSPEMLNPSMFARCCRS